MPLQAVHPANAEVVGETAQSHPAPRRLSGLLQPFAAVAYLLDLPRRESVRLWRMTNGLLNPGVPSRSMLQMQLAERAAELGAARCELEQQRRERQRTEAMLRQSQKMEAVGKLTGGVAHDFNNSLGVIIGNAEFLLDTLDKQSDQFQQAHDILQSALSGVELTRRLLAYASQQPLQPQLVDLNALMAKHVPLLRRTLGETIQVSTGLAADLWPTHSDPSQIGNALLNLALNARFAMPHGGSLRIETANVHLEPNAMNDGSLPEPGGYVALTVTDTGTGMLPEVIERATEPFFTTKPTGAGSGLGLSMIYGFARQSKGHLKITSEIGVGTAVSLYLPRAIQVNPMTPEPAEATVTEARGNESILLVDDNAALRDVARRHLLELGYTVDTAPDGPAALEILQSGRRVDLLFTDVIMPGGLSGYDLAQAAESLQQDVKVLFTTGFAGDPAIEDGMVEIRPNTLHKPYRHQDLARAVRVALDEPRRQALSRTVPNGTAV